MRMILPGNRQIADPACQETNNDSAC